MVETSKQNTSYIPDSRGNNHRQGALLLYCALQFAALIALALEPRVRNASSLAAFAVSAVCSILLCILSFFEHSKSIRPSTILILFLSLTALFDAVKVRTLWFLYPGATLTILFTTSTIVKGLAAFLETTHKSKHALPKTNDRSPEEKCGIISLCLSLWLEELLRRGLRWQISLAHLYSLGVDMSAQRLELSFLQQWEKQRSDQRDHYTLSWCCAYVLKWPLLGVIPLRLALLAFTVLQPLLLQSLLRYLGEPSASRDVGHGLIGAYVFVYLGMAVSMNIYWYYHLRTITKLRSVLVTAISKHTTAVNIQLLEDPKSPITLMSNDVERAVQGVRYLHEVWANAVQAGVAVYILERQAGVACVVPVGITVVICVAVVKVTSAIGGKQIKWMEAIQKRIAAISSLLASVKGVKMKGLEDRFHDIIANLRLQDVNCGSGFRKIIAYAGVLSFVPEFLCPSFTFLVLVAAPHISGSTFDATKIFTTLSVLLILTQPLANGFQVLPSVLAGFGSLKRIGIFLLTDQLSESRQFDYMSETSSYDLEFPEKGGQGAETRRASVIEVTCEDSTSPSNSPVFKITTGAFRWGTKSESLTDVNISVPRAMLTTIIGPVGSGKTTLCETLLGETQKTGGNIYARLESPEIAYCSQTPHLTNASIKENIIAYSSYDRTWYLDVLRATALSDEISKMPDRDDTIIGSKGSKLSGGQQQRVAIARAVFSQKKVIIFDDIFSGLDKTNARTIFNNLLGPGGLLRQSASTVILVTHSRTYLASSDHIIVLGSNGTVIAEGPCDEIVSVPGYEDCVPDTEDDLNEKSASQEANEEELQETKESEPEDEMKRARQPSDWRVYGFYAKAVGSLQLFLLAFFSVAAAAFWNYSTLWLRRWADHTADSGNFGNGYYLGIYALFQGLTIIFLFAVAMQSLTNVAAQSGRSLHAILLHTVLAAPLAFLTATDSGQIINRFSQDIQLIDSELPMALMNFVLCIASGTGQGVVITISSPWTGLAFPPLLVILYGIQKCYLRTSKQIRILDLEAKSPL